MRGTNRSRATRLLVAMLAVMAAAGGQAGPLEEVVGSPVGRDDLGLERNAERPQGLGGVSHRRPVGTRPHDDPDQGERGPGPGGRLPTRGHALA